MQINRDVKRCFGALKTAASINGDFAVVAHDAAMMFTRRCNIGGVPIMRPHFKLRVGFHFRCRTHETRPMCMGS